MSGTAYAETASLPQHRAETEAISESPRPASFRRRHGLLPRTRAGGAGCWEGAALGENCMFVVTRPTRSQLRENLVGLVPVDRHEDAARGPAEDGRGGRRCSRRSGRRPRLRVRSPDAAEDRGSKALSAGATTARCDERRGWCRARLGGRGHRRRQEAAPFRTSEEGRWPLPATRRSDAVAEAPCAVGGTPGCVQAASEAPGRALPAGVACATTGSAGDSEEPWAAGQLRLGHGGPPRLRRQGHTTARLLL